jgi:catechol-2,3-dioxygenase
MAGAATQPKLQFSHLGLVVKDLPRMEDFYTRVLGYKVTDRGTTGQGVTMVFMTLDPEEHHNLFLVDGKPDAALPRNTIVPHCGPVLHHLSFRVATLAELRVMYDRVRNEMGVTDLRPATHGLCWAVYFKDPEGNDLEFFADSPWYIYQPFYRPIDFSKPDAEILRETEEMCRNAPGFRPHKQFNDELRRSVKPFVGAD